MSQINTELGQSSSAQISLGSATVRSLLGVSSGAISLSNAYGKSSSFSAPAVTSSLTNVNLRTLLLSQGWDGTSAVIFTVNAGVYIYSTSTGTPALTISGSWPGGLSIVNNGFIIGCGGQGASFSSIPASHLPGSPGGDAISTSTNLTITNNGYICGGGGGGGGSSLGTLSGGDVIFIAALGGGGGAGGGSGGNTVRGPSTVTFTGGAGGGIGAAGSNGQGATDFQNTGTAGGGGGRVLPGSGGVYSAYGGQGGGAGGAGGDGTRILSNNFGGGFPAGNMGSGGGGGWGASGGNGGSATPAGSGGSSNNAGGSGAGNITGSGGAGGRAIRLNGNSVTWTNFGTTWGSVS
jgi:hypothetical protein